MGKGAGNCTNRGAIALLADESATAEQEEIIDDMKDVIKNYYLQYAREQLTATLKTHSLTDDELLALFDNGYLNRSYYCNSDSDDITNLTYTLSAEARHDILKAVADGLSKTEYSVYNIFKAKPHEDFTQAQLTKIVGRTLTKTQLTDCIASLRAQGLLQYNRGYGTRLGRRGSDLKEYLQPSTESKKDNEKAVAPLADDVLLDFMQQHPDDITRTHQVQKRLQIGQAQAEACQDRYVELGHLVSQARYHETVIDGEKQQRRSFVSYKQSDEFQATVAATKYGELSFAGQMILQHLATFTIHHRLSQASISAATSIPRKVVAEAMRELNKQSLVKRIEDSWSYGNGWIATHRGRAMVDSVS